MKKLNGSFIYQLTLPFSPSMFVSQICVRVKTHTTPRVSLDQKCYHHKLFDKTLKSIDRLVLYCHHSFSTNILTCSGHILYHLSLRKLNKDERGFDTGDSSHSCVGFSIFVMLPQYLYIALHLV